MSLYVTTCYYMLLYVTTCYYMLLYVIICYYMLLCQKHTTTSTNCSCLRCLCFSACPSGCLRQKPLRRDSKLSPSKWRLEWKNQWKPLGSNVSRYVSPMWNQWWMFHHRKDPNICQLISCSVYKQDHGSKWVETDQTWCFFWIAPCFGV